MKLDKNFIRQVVLYGIIGGGSAFLDFFLFTLLHKYFEINAYLANGISVHAGIAMSFVLNCKFNFKQTDKLLFRTVSFYLTGLLGLVLSQTLLWLGGTFLLPILMVKFGSIFAVAAIQFVINKLITFKKFDIGRLNNDKRSKKNLE